MLDLKLDLLYTLVEASLGNGSLRAYKSRKKESTAEKYEAFD